MSNLSVIERDGALVIDSRLIAQDLGVQHKNFLETLDKYQNLIEESFGIIAFETRKSERGRSERVAYLNEDQATFVMTLSRNTDRVVQCKIALVKAFSEAKRQLGNKSFITNPQLPPNTPIASLPADLSDLVRETNRLYGEFETLFIEPTPALEIGKEIGDRLLQLKEQVGHGGWEEFREQNIRSPHTGLPMPSSTATMYQRIAKNWDVLQQVNAQSIRDAIYVLRRDRGGMSRLAYPEQRSPNPQHQLEVLRQGIELAERLGGFDEYQASLVKDQILEILAEG
jgi:phage regulator Rha-like protein